MPRGKAESGFPRVAVKAPNWLGDAALSSAFFRELRKSWPGSHVAVFARRKVLPLARRLPGVDEVVEEKRGDLFGLARRLRAGNYDVAVSLSSSDVPPPAFWLARVPIRVGFRGGFRSLFLTDPVESPSRSVHQVFHYLKLGEPLGLKVSESPALELSIRREDRAEASRFLRRNGVGGKARLVAFAPGASFGPAKRWFTRGWAAAGDCVQLKHGATAVIVGGPAEREAAGEIGKLLARPALDATGRLSIPGTAALLSMCRAFLSNDSGLMHVGAAAGVPTLGLFGSSNPSWTGPFGRRNRVLWGVVECSPCYRRKCMQGRDYACLKAIKTEEVCSVLCRLAGFERDGKA